MKTRFKDPKLQQFYENCRRLGKDPSSEFYYAGRPHRGAGHRNAYWNGRQGLPCRYIRGTFAYSAWAAGQDDRKEEQP